VSYNRDVFKTVDDVSGTEFNIARDLGIAGQTNLPSDTGLPSIAITGMSGLGNSDINTIWDESRQIADHIKPWKPFDEVRLRVHDVTPRSSHCIFRERCI
jgi:hypothetical protein